MQVIEDRDAAVQQLTDVMWKFTSYIGKRLPTDVTHKLADLRAKETHPLAKAVYQSMKDNQDAADKLDRPSCQDTGVIQYFITAGARFPLLGELEDILSAATKEATIRGPLRHNAVETFDEKNTGTNTGTNIPWLDWRIVPDSDTCTIDVYMAGGGCTLPSTGSSSPEWQRRLGEVSSRVWARKEGGERIRLRIIHPIDTGLAAGIPAFFLQDLILTDDKGKALMHIEGFEPIAENPVFTVDVPAARATAAYRVSGRDNNGNAIAAVIEK